MRRVVITGLGPVTAAGTGLAKLRAALRARRSPIRRLRAFEPSMYHATSAAEVTDFDPREFFPSHRLKRLDRYAQFAVAAARLALADAGWAYDPARPQPRTGVSFGSALGGICDAEKEQEKFLRGGPKAVHPTLALQVFGGSAHANIAIECGFQGVGTTNSNSCASGTVALGEAWRYIRDGWADVMVAGGAEAPLCPLTFGAFDFIKTMSRHPPPECCRPFDRARDGFVMGEGAAALVLEEREHALRRGARIYAEVRGFSLNNDANHMTAPHPTGEPQVRAMAEAIERAGLQPSQIDHLNAHASSTRLNDANEAACLRQFFGPALERISVSATKPYTGHPLGATGAMEALLGCLMLADGWIPPVLHFEHPDDGVHLDLVTGSGREQKIRHLLSNSFGFGGINACLVLSAPQIPD
jgi:3-oxoacyl-[acyl-carrier-protein] synthase II